MTEEQHLAVAARAIVDEGRYMTLGTADEAGVPWASPVWYAPSSYREFLWVSDPQARHSRNIAARPEIAVVIFDSRVAPGSGEGVYMAAVAERVGAADLEWGIGVFSRRSQEQSLSAWTLADVTEPARLRLYRATASEVWFGRHDQRTLVDV
jgi:pyridoxine/pyridoxamine 5'-phosphate oxidase